MLIRSSADGKIRHQAQGTMAGGFLFGATLVNGAAQRFNLRQQMSEKQARITVNRGARCVRVPLATDG